MEPAVDSSSDGLHSIGFLSDLFRYADEHQLGKYIAVVTPFKTAPPKAVRFKKLSCHIHTWKND